MPEADILKTGIYAFAVATGHGRLGTHQSANIHTARIRRTSLVAVGHSSGLLGVLRLVLFPRSCTGITPAFDDAALEDRVRQAQTIIDEVLKAWRRVARQAWPSKIGASQVEE